MNTFLVSVLGLDQPGIIAALSRTIEAREGNIENASQTLLQDVFGALFVVSVPDSETTLGLQQALHEECASLGLFIHVDEYSTQSPDQEKPQTQPYIITSSGPDRKGLVAELSAIMARHELNITNMQAIFKGGNNPFDNLMVYEVDIPRHTVMEDLRSDLKALSQKLGLEINLQHRRIFEAVSDIDH